MRKRPASRFLVINAQLHVLLFRFEHKDDAMAGRAYWATPGGALEAGESFTQAAIRELWEETGLNITDPGEEIAQREFVMMMPNGKEVLADERYFIIRIQYHDLDCSQWTEHEKKLCGATTGGEWMNYARRRKRCIPTICPRYWSLICR